MEAFRPCTRSLKLLPSKVRVNKTSLHGFMRRLAKDHFFHQPSQTIVQMF
jgi:hypothetical protein